MTAQRAALAALVAAVAAGCGGDGGTADLAERANPICERANASLAALERPESLEQLLRYVDEATEVIEGRRRDLRALGAPEGSEDDWRAFLAANDRTLEALGEVRESTITGRGGEEAIRAFDAAETDARERAAALGLDACAERPSPPSDDAEEEEGAEDEQPQPATAVGGETTAWTARADEICAEAQGRIDALPQPTDPLSAAAQAARISTIVKREIADLRELEPRERDRARVTRFLAGLGREANSLDRLVQAMSAGDEDAVDRYIGEGQAAADQARREAGALGLMVCGRG